MFKYVKFSIIIGSVISITSCTGVNLTDWHFPYMMEVQQGTYITNSQYNQLKIGMQKEQISYIIGKPLNQYIFDQNRWDYIYQDYKNNNLKKKYNVTILFDKNGNATNITKTGELFDK